MEALLATPSNSHLCDSVADLQVRLSHALHAKVSQTRAEHISSTFELPSSVIFNITATETESETHESAAHINPQLGEPQTSAPSSTVDGSQSARQISAIDTLVNQPDNDPALQRTVTKHLIAALGELDRANWVVRQVSRVAQGWTFTYICKDSSQAWARQHARHPSRIVEGEWSSKDSQGLAHMGMDVISFTVYVHTFFF